MSQMTAGSMLMRLCLTYHSDGPENSNATQAKNSSFHSNGNAASGGDVSLSGRSCLLSLGDVLLASAVH